MLIVIAQNVNDPFYFSRGSGRPFPRNEKINPFLLSPNESFLETAAPLSYSVCEWSETCPTGTRFFYKYQQIENTYLVSTKK